jgi:hypothetical protein
MYLAALLGALLVGMPAGVSADNEEDASVTPASWWCAQAEHSGSLLCGKMRFKEAYRKVKDPEERAAMMRAHREESLTRPSPDDLHNMRDEESQMMDDFCKLADHKGSSFCDEDRLKWFHERQAHELPPRPTHAGAQETLDRGPGHGPLGEKPIIEYDVAVEWYCKDGGHPDASTHSEESMICAAWKFRTQMHAVAHGDGSSKQAIIDEYRKIKEARKAANPRDVEVHVNEQQEMLSAYCAIDTHASTKLCLKWLARKTKTELRTRRLGE